MKRKVPEPIYRCSRICRILGNPTAYEIIALLTRGRQKPTDLSRRLMVSVPAVSQALRSLRNLDLVRYENAADGKYYFIKEEMILKLLNDLNQIVRRLQRGDY